MKQPYILFLGSIFTPEQQLKIAENATPFFFGDDTKLDQAIKNCSKKPDVIVIVGTNYCDTMQIGNMLPKDQQRVIQFQTAENAVNNIEITYYCFVTNAIRYNNDSDLVTIFTSSYKSGDMILRPLESLLKQKYKNWEWIIMDDSDGDENFQNLVKIKNRDPRIRIYRSDKNSGVIGQVKNVASSLARGAYLIEMDHDDELVPEAVGWVYEAFQQFPDAGMAYSDFLELFTDGRNFNYGDFFALGYGAYRKEFHNGRWRDVCICPPINPVVIRYLVASPNHLRAWRKSTFQEIGGWNHNLHVADDFEILIRTFLKSKFVRIPFLSYYQYRNEGGNNFTFIRNKEIQKLVKVLRNYYNNKIHERVVNELKIEDPYWDGTFSCHRVWTDAVYEERLNYVSHHDKKLVSIVIPVTKSTTNQHLVSSIVGQLLMNDYHNFEIMVVGGGCGFLEMMMNPFRDPRVKWWNLEDGSVADLLNYACKLVIRGEFIVYPVLADILIPTNYIGKQVEAMLADDKLMWSPYNEIRRSHRTSIFRELNQYWKENELLYDVWKDSNKAFDDIEKKDPILKEPF